MAAWRVVAGEVNVVGGHNRTWVEVRDKKIKWFSKVKAKVCCMFFAFPHKLRKRSIYFMNLFFTNAKYVKKILAHSKCYSPEILSD